MPRQSRALAAMSLMSVVAAFEPVVLPPVDKYGAQTVTAADQVVYLPGYEYATSTKSYSDNVVTTVCPEVCPSGKVVGWEDSYEAGSPMVIIYRYDIAYEEVYEKEITCPYSEVGPYAFPGFPGSGICTECDSHQTGYVKECYNNNCAAYSCGWGSDYSHQCESYSKPNGYIVAPPGCQNVCANYEDCYGGSCSIKQSCYTVPYGNNFPPIYPPGFCHECQLPPGWTTIVTVLPDATATTTLTVPTTVTVTTGTSTPSALACPGSNNQIVVGNSGSTFQVQCNVGITGTEINARDIEERAIFARALGTTGNFNQCIQLCDDNDTCAAVAYNPDTGLCRGFTEGYMTTTTPSDTEWVATLIQRANGATSTTSSSTESSSSSSMETTSATSTTTDVSTTSSTTSSAQASSSDGMNARDVRGDNLVPKRFARKAAHIRL